ncbi:MAG: acyl-CoA thioesterase II [Deltaproteobacteria bacterium]|nr:MAG: acyl-CoA thioesterase II [Deltaproteobacteria bacterium]
MTDAVTERTEAEVLADLVDLLRLECIEETIYRGRSQDLGWGAIFGGQVLGQALWAAAHTVDPERRPHSLHAYFLRSGDAKRPVVYQVDRSRDGRSFSTRRIVAVQKGRPIFHMAVSFQVDEPGFEHQDPMPSVPGPEGLATERELAAKIAPKLPEPLRTEVVAPRPIEIRLVDPQDPLHPTPRPPQRYAWLRAAAQLPDDPIVHLALLAYASDFHFLTTALAPHGVSWLTPGMKVASLDHAMWFHRPLRFDDWVLYAVHSPAAAGARGLVHGRLYARDGTLVASTAQEGLIRKRDFGG